jgi:hypothetical protein
VHDIDLTWPSDLLVLQEEVEEVAAAAAIAGRSVLEDVGSFQAARTHD